MCQYIITCSYFVCYSEFVFGTFVRRSNKSTIRPGDISKGWNIAILFLSEKKFQLCIFSMNTNHQHHYITILSQPHRHESRTSWISLGRNFGYYYLSPTSLLGGLKPVLVFLVYLPPPNPLLRSALRKKKLLPVRLQCTCHRHALLRRSVVNWYRICHWMLTRKESKEKMRGIFLHFPGTPILILAHVFFPLLLYFSLYFFIDLSSLFLSRYLFLYISSTISQYVTRKERKNK